MRFEQGSKGKSEETRTFLLDKAFPHLIVPKSQDQRNITINVVPCLSKSS